MFAHSRRRGHKYHLSELHLVVDFAVNEQTYQDVVSFLLASLSCTLSNSD